MGQERYGKNILALSLMTLLKDLKEGAGFELFVSNRKIQMIPHLP